MRLNRMLSFLPVRGENSSAEKSAEDKVEVKSIGKEAKNNDKKQSQISRVPIYYKVTGSDHQNSTKTNLISYAWSCDWHNVILYCRKFPQEACVINMRWGRTALHLALFSRTCPSNVINALLEANKHAVLVHDKNGYTPLHYACQFRHPTASIKLLCDAIVGNILEIGHYDRLEVINEPISATINNASDKGTYVLGNASMSDWNAPSPLFLACRNDCSILTLQLLVETSETCNKDTQWIAPFTGAEPWYNNKLLVSSMTYQEQIEKEGRCFNEISPLHIMWHNIELHWYYKLLDHLERFGLDNDTMKLNEPTKEEKSSISLKDDDIILDLWEKTIFLLKTSYRQSQHDCLFSPKNYMKNCPDFLKGNTYLSNKKVDNQCTWILQFASALTIPHPRLVEIIAKFYRHSQRDFNDCEMSPLHHALMSFTNNPHIEMEQMNETVRVLVSAYLSFNNLHCGNQHKCMDIHGETASPLIMAIDCVSDKKYSDTHTIDLLRMIIDAMPETMCQINKKIRMYPLMYAALCDTSINTIYYLLKSSPHLLKT